jgi:hypothetical protein
MRKTGCRLKLPSMERFGVISLRECSWGLGRGNHCWVRIVQPCGGGRATDCNGADALPSMRNWSQTAGLNTSGVSCCEFAGPVIGQCEAQCRAGRGPHHTLHHSPPRPLPSPNLFGVAARAAVNGFRALRSARLPTGSRPRLDPIFSIAGPQTVDDRGRETPMKSTQVRPSDFSLGRAISRSTV